MHTWHRLVDAHGTTRMHVLECSTMPTRHMWGSAGNTHYYAPGTTHSSLSAVQCLPGTCRVLLAKACGI